MNKELINQLYNQAVLDFYWKATRKDNSVFFQFEQTGNTIKVK